MIDAQHACSPPLGLEFTIRMSTPFLEPLLVYFYFSYFSLRAFVQVRSIHLSPLVIVNMIFFLDCTPRKFC
jgi:hypothetical protein